MTEAQQGQDNRAFQNTNKHLWPITSTELDPPSIHVTAQGNIGINVSGYVIVKSLRNWHKQDARIAELEAALSELKWAAKHLACMYRPANEPETASVNDTGIDQTMHCCDWNEVYEICCEADGEENPRGRRVLELKELRRARDLLKGEK